MQIKAYIKTSNTGAGDKFGVSSNATVLAVYAFAENSNGNQSNNSKNFSGAVYLY
ncbi:hypothetical protein N9W78_01920 [bacterium]|nr:hypothetical protein [bacterium]MDB2449026.1 hypothetical protein [bacterium]